MQRNHLLLPLALFFVFSGWQSFAAEAVCSLQIAWAQVGIPSPDCPDTGCTVGGCKMHQLDWTDGQGVDHSLHMCGCDDSVPSGGCFGWLEIVYGTPITVNGDCIFPTCPKEGQECQIQPMEEWPMRPDPRIAICICVAQN